MRVSDDIQKTVGFVAYEAGNGKVLCGTAFVVSLPLGPKHTARFAVTAAHVIEGIAGRTVDLRVHLRFSRKGGGVAWIETDLRDWITHPTDPVVDCALVLLPLPDAVDVLQIRLGTGNDWLSPYATRAFTIGVGDDLVFPGLFTSHAGRTRTYRLSAAGRLQPCRPSRSPRSVAQWRPTLSRPGPSGG